MKTATKIWLIVAAALVLLGTVAFLGVMTMLNWDFTKLSTTCYETATHEIYDDFSNVVIVTDTANIVWIPAEGAQSTITCLEEAHAKHTVTVKDGTLRVELNDTRKWYEHIGIRFGTPKITLALPRGEYGALSVKTATGNVEIPDEFGFESVDIAGTTGCVTIHADASRTMTVKTTTGNIRLENVFADDVNLAVSTGSVTVQNVTCRGDMAVTVSTGKVNFENVSCENLTSSGSTGNVVLKNTVAAQKCNVTRSTGNVTFDRSDAAEILVETNTGHVRGTLLSEKIFFAHTSTGRISVPKTATGGRCEIATDTGNIQLELITE